MCQSLIHGSHRIRPDIHQHFYVCLCYPLHISEPRFDISNSITFPVSTMPQDLRIAIKPLHTRLSSSTAGMPVDELADIQIIRDHWVEIKARQEVHAGEKVNVRFVFKFIIPSLTIGRLQNLMDWMTGFAWAHLMSMERCLRKIYLLGWEDLSEKHKTTRILQSWYHLQRDYLHCLWAKSVLRIPLLMVRSATTILQGPSFICLWCLCARRI